MNRDIFLRILNNVENHESYFVQRRNAVGTLGLSSLQKVTAALRILAYGVGADLMDEYVRIGETTVIKSMKLFAKAVSVRIEHGRENPFSCLLPVLAFRCPLISFPAPLHQVACDFGKREVCFASGHGFRLLYRKYATLYLTELLAERQKMIPFMQVLPFCHRLLNLEIMRASGLVPNHSFVDSERMDHGSPLRLGEPMDLEGWSGMQTEVIQFYDTEFCIKTTHHCYASSSFFFQENGYLNRVGTIQTSNIGWNGITRVNTSPIVKKIVRLDVPVDKYPNEEKLRDKPGYEHLNEPLHVLVEAEFTADVVDGRLDQAVTILEDLLKPVVYINASLSLYCHCIPTTIAICRVVLIAGQVATTHVVSLSLGASAHPQPLPATTATFHALTILSASPRQRHSATSRPVYSPGEQPPAVNAAANVTVGAPVVESNQRAPLLADLTCRRSCL
ncbi:hypothetical protein ZIOFF_059788 [Zingiber officinale]|uniref:STAR protein homodimerisation region domain-containing protein n=1 Tax=Zingiber officinale TaxID=94328 RepID=A0A8J5FAT4_ZINOF|nr:hypothetical protein ZIOFF_059788 [Zingiber officinale]